MHITLNLKDKRESVLILDPQEDKVVLSLNGKECAILSVEDIKMDGKIFGTRLIFDYARKDSRVHFGQNSTLVEDEED